ncbi:hypothetical protein H0H92_013634 [Tricholoma furcatifolium]|nr:hypothetical protein H0H92_013634 [Tricholoma furcatifolium]
MVISLDNNEPQVLPPTIVAQAPPLIIHQAPLPTTITSALAAVQVISVPTTAVQTAAPTSANKAPALTATAPPPASEALAPALVPVNKLPAAAPAPANEAPALADKAPAPVTTTLAPALATVASASLTVASASLTIATAPAVLTTSLPAQTTVPPAPELTSALTRKNLEIPLLTTSIPLMTTVTASQALKKPNTKPLKAKEGVTTARCIYSSLIMWFSIFLIDYLEAHPDYKATEGQFTALWKACDSGIRTKYEQLSKDLAKECKKGTQATSTPTRVWQGYSLE